MLHRTEQEDQQRDSYLRGHLASRSARGSQRNHFHPHGGSLQDLVEAVNNEQLLDSDYLLAGQNKRHHLHSRHKKNNSSVSSRQREGGSLPSNVNVSTPYREPFLYELNSKPTCGKGHKERSCGSSCSGSSSSTGGGGSGGPGLGSRQNSIGSGCRDDIGGDTKKTHTVIEIDCDDEDETKHLLAHDSLAQVSIYTYIHMSIYVKHCLSNFFSIFFRVSMSHCPAKTVLR